MKLDTQLFGTDLRDAGPQARRFERLGFDGAWTFEAGRDPFLPLALAAAASERLELGPNVAIAFARSPMSMAQAAWDVQKLSGGRLKLGIGTQVRAHIERRYSMPYDRPVARITDYVRCLQAIWTTFQTGAKPDYRGEFYQFTLVNPMFNPGPIDHPEIPIYLAGVNPRICHAAGLVADGFHVHPMHTVAYLKDVVIPKIDEGARVRGKTVRDLELYSPVFAITGETQAEWDRSERDARRQVSFYGSTPTYRPVLEHRGYGEVGRKLSEMARRGEWAAMESLVPDDFLEQVAVAAKPAELPAALRRRYDGILQRVSLYSPIGPDSEDPRWKEFIATFRAAGG